MSVLLYGGSRRAVGYPSTPWPAGGVVEATCTNHEPTQYEYRYISYRNHSIIHTGIDIINSSFGSREKSYIAPSNG